MESLEVSLAEDENNNIQIVFGSEDSIIVDTSGDIDLTDLVAKLANLIDDPKTLILEKLVTDDPKITIIQNTISDIASSFNESIAMDLTDENDPF